MADPTPTPVGFQTEDARELLRKAGKKVPDAPVPAGSATPYEDILRELNAIWAGKYPAALERYMDVYDLSLAYVAEEEGLDPPKVDKKQGKIIPEWGESVAKELVDEIAHDITQQFTGLTSEDEAAVKGFVLNNLAGWLAAGEGGPPEVTVPMPDRLLDAGVQDTAVDSLREKTRWVLDKPEAPTYTVQYKLLIEAAEDAGLFGSDMARFLKDPKKIPAGDIITSPYVPDAAMVGEPVGVPTKASSISQYVLDFITAFTSNRDNVLDAIRGEAGDFYEGAVKMVEGLDPTDPAALLPSPITPEQARAREQFDEMVKAWADTGSLEEALNIYYHQHGKPVPKSGTPEKAVYDRALENLEIAKAQFKADNPGADDIALKTYLLSTLPQEQWKVDYEIDTAVQQEAYAQGREEQFEEAQKRFELSQTSSGAKNQLEQFVFDNPAFMDYDSFREEDKEWAQRAWADVGGDERAFTEGFKSFVTPFETAGRGEQFVKGGADSIEKLLISMGIGGTPDTEYSSNLKKSVVPGLKRAFEASYEQAPYAFSTTGTARRFFGQYDINTMGQLVEQQYTPPPPAAQVGDMGDVFTPEEPALLSEVRERREEAFQPRAFAQATDMGQIPMLESMNFPGATFAPSLREASDEELLPLLRSMAETPEELQYLISQIPQFKEGYLASQGGARQASAAKAQEYGLAFQEQQGFAREKLALEGRTDLPGGNIPTSARDKGVLERAAAGVPTGGIAALAQTSAPSLSTFIGGQKKELRRTFEDTPLGMQMQERAAAEETQKQRERLRVKGRTTYRRAFV